MTLGSRRLWIPIMCLGVAALCAAVLTLAGIYLYLNPQVPNAATYRDVKLETPLRVLSRDGKLLAEFGERRVVPVTMDEVPDLFVRALVDTEDKRFFSHRGIDYISLVNDSIDLILNPNGDRSGASTLTMQLARNVSFSLEQTFIRKFKEMLLALKIEQQLSKREILNLYINIAPFGKRAYGAEAGAQTYYGKKLTELELAQLAMLAGIPKSPSSANPVNGPEQALRRRNLVLSRMLAQKSITQAEYAIAIDAPLTAKLHRQDGPDLAPYPAELVRQQLVGRYPDLYTAGYVARTTIESNLQRKAISAVRAGLHGYDERHGYRGPLANIEIAAQPQLQVLLNPPATDEQSNDEDIDPSKIAEASDDDSATEQGDTATATLGSPLPQQLIQQIDEAINTQPELGGASTAVVVAVGEQNFLAALSEGEIAIVEWNQIRWAREHLNVDRRGPAPESASDVVATGDVIRLRRAPRNIDPDQETPTSIAGQEQELVWHLAQEPEIQGALVAVHPQTGAVRALTGGYDFSRNQYNHAVQARRQPGSGFKPFVYSAAIANGVTPADIFMDAPIVLDDEGLEDEYRPGNDSRRYNGPTRLREALYRSINLVSIRVLLDVGAGNVLKHANRFGFDTEYFPRNTQLGIGGGTMAIPPIDMARAYSVFANGGYLIEPHLLLSVEQDGQILESTNYPAVCQDCEEAYANVADQNFGDLSPDGTAVELATDISVGPLSTDTADSEVAAPPSAKRVLPKDNAFIMHTMLQDVISRGTGHKAKKLGRRDIAGKTGTTNDAADTWFNGYNSEFATSVWVGFGDHTPLGAREYGATTPLPIWIDFMGEALTGVEEQNRDQPENVISLKIDAATGEIARAGQSNAIFEYFLEGNIPERRLDDAGDTFNNQDDAREIDTTDLF